MKLRPRYSLLTLLVVTALVAGGVKLWYGPHHVIERPLPNIEFEYTYTRDWRGNMVYSEPCIGRAALDKPISVIWLCKQGTLQEMCCMLSVVDPSRTSFFAEDQVQFLSPDQTPFKKYIELEMQRYRDFEGRSSISWTWNFSPDSFEQTFGRKN